MSDGVMLPDAEYGLAETAILSGRWLSNAALPDELSRPTVVNTSGEANAPVMRIAVSSNGPLPRTFVKSVEAIAEILQLRPGWNSHSAKPVSLQNAIRAIQLLSEMIEPLTPAPLIVPRVQGGLQLEWHTESGDIEVYITSPEAVSFFAESFESGESVEAPVTGKEEVLKAWIQRITGK